MISQVLLIVALSTLAAASLPVVHEPIYHHAPQPYAFGYSVKDKHGEQHREESGTGGHAVKGSYGFTDDRGVQRQVNYVADGAGFRAQVKTNEPGTANQNPAAVEMISNAPYAGPAGYGAVAAPLAVNGLGYGGLGYNGAGYGYGGLGYGYGAGYGGYGAGLGYGGAYGAGLGYGAYGGGLGYGGLGLGVLGGLGYARYGY